MQEFKQECAMASGGRMRSTRYDQSRPTPVRREWRLSGPCSKPSEEPTITTLASRRFTRAYGSRWKISP
jgi:hypothetical protein